MVWSHAPALVAMYKTFANGHLKLLRVQDKKDSADGDVGVPPLPNNYRSYNIRVESIQI